MGYTIAENGVSIIMNPVREISLLDLLKWLIELWA
jgi:hypothetical protein